MVIIWHGLWWYVQESLKNQVQALEDEMTRLRSKAKEEATRVAELLQAQESLQDLVRWVQRERRQFGAATQGDH